MSTINAPVPMTVSCDNEAVQMNVGMKMTTGTTSLTDKEPYLFRKSKSGSADVAVDKIVGGTVAWNQLLDGSVDANWAANNATKSFSDGICTFTASAKDGYVQLNVTRMEKDHVYLSIVDMKTDTATNLVAHNWYGGEYKYCESTTNWQTVESVSKRSASNKNFKIRVSDRRTSGWDAVQVKNFMLFDITTMFGSTIADYVYALESGTAGAGIAWLKKYGYFTKPYYPYAAANLQSVKTSAHKTIGFNQWDEEWELGGIDSATGENTVGTNTIRAKNKFRILPNTVYHLKCSAAVAARYYDANENYLAASAAAIKANSNFTTPSEAAYMRFQVFAAYGTTYNHDICINLHWDGERDGEYEPYVAHEYALDDITLRGILKLDANNNLYYDGDEYTADGTVTRKYGIVDLGTLTYSKSSSVVNTFVAVDGMPSDFPVAPNTTSIPNWVSIYENYSNVGIEASGIDKAIAWRVAAGNNGVMIRDIAYATLYTNNDVAGFKTAMSGVYLVYELATPTTETADPYTNPQKVDASGTEEYVDSREVPIPVGHETQYVTRQTAETSVDAYPMTVTHGIEV